MYVVITQSPRPKAYSQTEITPLEVEVEAKVEAGADAGQVTVPRSPRSPPTSISALDGEVN